MAGIKEKPVSYHGQSWGTLHGRLFSMQYDVYTPRTREKDWIQLSSREPRKERKATVNVPVLGRGDNFLISLIVSFSLGQVSSNS